MNSVKVNGLKLYDGGAHNSIPLSIGKKEEEQRESFLFGIGSDTIHSVTLEHRTLRHYCVMSKSPPVI